MTVMQGRPHGASRPPILYLTHRIPYPPNKGDKLRSFNLLRKLAERHRVFLGTFIDSPEDRETAAGLGPWCEEVCALPLAPAVARAWSLRGLLRGEPLSVSYYRHARLRRWVEQVIAAHDIRTAVAFSGPMGQYLDAPQLRRRIIDFCDVDSAKWREYSARHRWPMSWLYRREARRLFEFEQHMARQADHSLLTTDEEVRLLTDTAPELSGRVIALQNGVDAEYFSPALACETPYPPGGPVLVFTGAMDYWPNIDAVTWFVREILPGLRQSYPSIRFCIVGMNPAAQVRALTRDASVTVTGRVDDVRPWIAHATLAVAPLRIARGVQNKVLEAMAMARAVVVTSAAAKGLSGRPGEVFVSADGAIEFRCAIVALLQDSSRREALGKAAREHVLRHYNWAVNLAVLDELCAA